MPVSDSVWIVLDSANFGGIESHVVQLAKGLTNRNIQLSVILLDDYSAQHGLHPLIAMLQHEHIKFSVLDGRFKTLITKLKSERPLICHTHGYKAGILTRLACSLTNIPCITTYHAGERNKGKLGLYDFIDRSTAFLNAYSTAVSNDIRQRVYGPCKQMNNFISTQGLAKSKGSNIGFVGRLSSEKNPEAFIQLADAFPDECFDIFGDGPLRNSLEENAGDNCKFHGHVNMSEHWNELKILIICSHFEGLPLCLLEAMARGIIVVSYELGEIPRVIRHQENGFLVGQRSAKALKENLKHAIHMPRESQVALRNNARLTIQDHYSTDSVLSQYIAVYQKYAKVNFDNLGNGNNSVNPRIQHRSNALTILFVHYGEDWIRGSEICLINLVCRLKEVGIEPIVWCNSDVLYKELKQRGIRVKKQYFSILLGWEKPRFNIVNFTKLIRTAIGIIDRNKVDLVHTNGGAPNQWMLIAARHCARPIVTQLHAPYLKRDRLSLSLRGPDKVVGVSRAVIAPFFDKCKRKESGSEGLRDQVQITDNKYSVIYNGIDLSPYTSESRYKYGQVPKTRKIDIRQKLKISKSDYVVISVGSLIQRKGFDLLIKAIALLRKNTIPAALIIVGEGPEHDNLNNLCAELNVSQFVHFLGERKDVPELLQSEVDVFASGAREEAFGLVFAEAGAAGLASVAPNVGGIPEVIHDGKSGLLVRPESHTEIASALSHLRTFKLERREMEQYARKRIFTLFGQERNTLAFQSLYQELTHNDTKSGWQSTLNAYLHPFISFINFAFTRKC